MRYQVSSLKENKLITILKFLILPDFLALVSSLIVLKGTSVLLNSWPHVLFLSSTSFSIIKITFSIFILVLIWNFLNKIIKHHFSKLLFGAKIILILNLLQAIFIGSLIGGRPSTEIANVNVDKIDYHLVYSSGCIDACSNNLSLYRCDSLKWVCSSIDFKYYPYFHDGRSQQLPFDISHISLDFDKTNEKIYILDLDKTVIEIFKTS